MASGLPLSAASRAAWATRSRAPPRGARGARGGRGKARRRFRPKLCQQLFEDAAAVALEPQVAGEGPHRRAGLSTSTSIWAQNDCSFGCTSAGNHGTSTSTSIPTSTSGSALSGAEAGEARAASGRYCSRCCLRRRDAGELRDFRDHLRGARIAAAVAGDEDGILRRDQPLRERGDEFGSAPPLVIAPNRSRGIAVDVVERPRLRSASPAASSDRPGRAARFA